MPPRINAEGVYCDEDTVNLDGTPVPLTQEEADRTAAYEAEHGIPATLPPPADDGDEGDEGDA